MNEDNNKNIFLNIKIFTVLFLYFYYQRKIKKDFYLTNKNEDSLAHIINEPILPLETEDIPKRDYSRTYYNSQNIRFHFEDLYNNRKLYKINYSYLPYKELKKYDSYDKAADYIFELTGMLNITLLNFYYNTIIEENNDFNHIHLGMAFDRNYIILSKISMASILNTSSNDTYIHFHIGLNGCKYSDIKILLDLIEINKNAEFIFYKGIQAELDFSNKDIGTRGIGDYTRILLPQIVNNTNKIIILDSGDIIVQKDLSELYFFDIKDNYFALSLEFYAGNFDKYYIFLRNNFYPNTGVCLVNIRKFREDGLYKRAYFSKIAYNHLPCPYQDIFLMISNYKFKFWPLNYNAPQFFKTDDEMNEKNYNSVFRKYLESQNKTIFRYEMKELIEAAFNPVIVHLYFNKPYMNGANKKYTNMWIEYSKLAKVYKQIKKKYEIVFQNLDKKR